MARYYVKGVDKDGHNRKLLVKADSKEKAAGAKSHGVTVSEVVQLPPEPPTEVPTVDAPSTTFGPHPSNKCILNTYSSRESKY